jgi:hypothetical protein
VRLPVSDLVAERDRPAPGAPVLARLSRLDRFLPVWIVAAMAAGLVLGRLVPGLDDALDAVRVGEVSLPIAVGLLLMMYPVLAKVRYSELDRVTGDRRLLGASLALNWLVGPALMFALAWLGARGLRRQGRGGGAPDPRRDRDPGPVSCSARSCPADHPAGQRRRGAQGSSGSKSSGSSSTGAAGAGEAGPCSPRRAAASSAASRSAARWARSTRASSRC